MDSNIPFEGADHAPKEDAAPDHSESALALKFRDRHAHEMRYVDAWGKWMHWNASVWRKEMTRLAHDFAHRIVREDGQLSIARSFRKAEWEDYLRQAGIAPEQVRIVRRFASRLCVERVR